MARVINFEGRRITVPDDATDDEVRAIIEGSAPAAPKAAPSGIAAAAASMQPAAPAQPDPIRALTLGTQDVGRGAANLAGLPFDLTNTALNLGLTGADKIAELFGGNLDYRLPVGAGKTIAEGAGAAVEAAGVPLIDWEDRTGNERMAGSMIELGTEALGGGAALATRAPAMISRVATGQAAPRLADAFVRPYMNNAARTLAGDVASGIGSGLGVHIANENDIPYIPEPVEQGLAALLGGVGGSAGLEAAHAAGRFGLDRFVKPAIGQGIDKNIPIDPTTNLPAKRADVEVAARTMQETARDPLTGAPRNVEAARAIEDNAARFRDQGLPVPTTGLISENTGLQQAEAAARTRNAAPFKEADDRLKAAATERAGSIRDPDADQGAVKETVAARPSQIKAERDVEALPFLKKAEESGAVVDPTPVAALIDEKLATAKRPPVRSALTEARKMLNKVGSDDLDTSVSGLYEARKAINDVIEGRGENPTGKFAQKELIEVRAALDEAITKASPEFGEYLNRFREGSAPLDFIRDNKSTVKALQGKDPRSVAESILNDNYNAGKRFEDIDTLIGTDEAARRGWKAAVAEVLTDRITGTSKMEQGTGEFRVELGKIDALFKKHRANLAKVFTPEEMNRLQQAQAALEPLKNATIRATAGSNTADKYEQIWRATEAGLKAKFGVLKGGGILRTLRIVAKMMPDNTDAVNRIITRASFDPDMAQYLLTRKVRDLNYAESNKWVRWALTGQAGGAAEDEDEE